MATSSSALLRTGLSLNLIFSSACGLAAVFFGPEIARATGSVPAWAVTGLGAGLIIFAAGIGTAVLRLRLSYALLISLLDALWVLTTVPLIFIPNLLSPAGDIVVLMVAGAVAIFFLTQMAGIKRMLAADAPAGRYRHCLRIRSSAHPETLWQVIRDIGAISRFSPGLSSSRVEGGDVTAPGCTRVCTDTGGKSWAEEVERLDDEARELILRFKTEADDFPFPFDALSGGWSVKASPKGGSLVDIWWVAMPKNPRIGWLFFAVMAVAMDKTVPAILAAMEAEATGQAQPKKPLSLAPAYC